jgi:hypothetical protein
MSDIENVLHIDWVKYEPVVVGWALSGGLAVLLGEVIGISPGEEAAVTTILTGLVALYTMFRTKEFVATTFTGILTTIAVAAAAFGLHLSSQEIGAGVAVLGGVIALVLRQNVTPTALRPVAFIVK